MKIFFGFRSKHFFCLFALCFSLFFVCLGVNVRSAQDSNFSRFRKPPRDWRSNRKGRGFSMGVSKGVTSVSPSASNVSNSLNVKATEKVVDNSNSSSRNSTLFYKSFFKCKSGNEIDLDNSVLTLVRSTSGYDHFVDELQDSIPIGIVAMDYTIRYWENPKPLIVIETFSKDDRAVCWLFRFAVHSKTSTGYFGHVELRELTGSIEEGSSLAGRLRGDDFFSLIGKFPLIGKSYVIPSLTAKAIFGEIRALNSLNEFLVPFKRNFTSGPSTSFIHHFSKSLDLKVPFSNSFPFDEGDMLLSGDNRALAIVREAYKYDNNLKSACDPYAHLDPNPLNRPAYVNYLEEKRNKQRAERERLDREEERLAQEIFRARKAGLFGPNQSSRSNATNGSKEDYERKESEIKLPVDQFLSDIADSGKCLIQ